MGCYKRDEITLVNGDKECTGWLCTPKDENIKSAVVLVAPENNSRNQVLMQYITRLANSEFIVLGIEDNDMAKPAIDYLYDNFKTRIEKIFLLGIYKGVDGVIQLMETEERPGAIAMVSGFYTIKEGGHIKTPTLVIQGMDNNTDFLSASYVFNTIKSDEKLAIWEDSTLTTQYSDDPFVMDRTVRHIVRWFKTH